MIKYHYMYCIIPQYVSAKLTDWFSFRAPCLVIKMSCYSTILVWTTITCQKCTGKEQSLFIKRLILLLKIFTVFFMHDLKSMLMIHCLIWIEWYGSSYALLVYLIVGKRAGCKFHVTIGKESTEFCLI